MATRAYAAGEGPGSLIVITNARYVARGGNDGDSFHVALDGQVRAVRLYFVDTPETTASELTVRRVREQMRYFGHTNPAHTVAYGHRAAAFTRRLLRQPFTVYTAFANALGSTEGGRIYVFVVTADGKDLGEELVRRGLARAYGMGRTTPSGLSREEYAARLCDLELVAAMTRAGAWEASVPERLVKLRAQEREEAQGVRAITSSLAAQHSRINLNTATREELMQLKGVGAKRAEAIMRARPFTSAADVFSRARLATARNARDTLPGGMVKLGARLHSARVRLRSALLGHALDNVAPKLRTLDFAGSFH
ncbi:MAG: helix-hairpin-helix domain-containing protein [bacterium]|nr:helix-hairpin-helix domain-containing protein [bacterium]